MQPSPAKLLFLESRAAAVNALTSSSDFRSIAINSFIKFLRHTVAEAEYPWTEFQVGQDLRLCIQYTDERRGQALIRTIIDLIVEMLTGKTDLAILFRDENNPVFTENSPATEKVFRVFQAAGGRFVALQVEWLADFCALIELRRAAERGAASGGNLQSEVRISVEDFQQFVSHEFHTGFVRALAESIGSTGGAESGIATPSRGPSHNVSHMEWDGGVTAG